MKQKGQLNGELLKFILLAMIFTMLGSSIVYADYREADSITIHKIENSSEPINGNAKRFALTVGIGGCHEERGVLPVEQIYGINSQISGEIILFNDFQWAIGFNHFYFKHFNENTRIGNSGHLMSIVVKKYIGSYHKNNTFVSVHLGGLPFPPRGFDAGIDVLHKLNNTILIRCGLRYISNLGMRNLESKEPIYGTEYSPTMITIGVTYVL